MNEAFDTQDDDQIIDQLAANPQDIAKLLAAKRKANAEAKLFRERLETAEEALKERETLSSEVERLRARGLRDAFFIEALQERIKPNRLEAAFKIADLDLTAEDPATTAKAALGRLKEGFPELFAETPPPPEVDNAGFSRAKPDPLTAAKASGNTMAMLKALRSQ